MSFIKLENNLSISSKLAKNLQTPSKIGIFYLIQKNTQRSICCKLKIVMQLFMSIRYRHC
ncbi:hypothetical protein BpHYR1_014486 [Brachionus plicatilis]|uniref:Uncharacterized protein n=1 Tax=Brachionus plicatilis TaxID=10195 RepID=A0A3M7R9M4_BRAPC|nr:hypothetical protein BpHYR1_014486 [Brachionus plicatilis]